MTNHFDIAIIGGGIAGFSLAHFLGDSRKILLLERESAFGYHSTARSAGEFSYSHHTPLVGKLAKLSFPFLERPEPSFSETNLLNPRGAIYIASEDKRDKLSSVFDEERRHSHEMIMLTVEDAIKRAPILKREFFSSAFYDPNCWDIEVANLFQSYIKSAKKSGVVAHTKAELLTATRKHSIWQIDTSAGPFSASTIVNASGAWADQCAAIFGAAPIGIAPLRRTVITVDLPPDINAATLPEVAEIEEDFYMKPDAGKLMISPADEHPSEPCDAQPEELDIAWAMHWLSESTTIRARHVSHSWAGLRSFAPDRAPVVGWDEKIEGLFWLAGQGGFGIQTSPALGRLAASLLLSNTQPDDFEDQGFDLMWVSPKRFS